MSNLDPACVADTVVAYPGSIEYNQFEELAPDMEIEAPKPIEHPDDTFGGPDSDEDANSVPDDGEYELADYEQAEAKRAEQLTWLCSLLKTLPNVKFSRSVTSGFDPTEMLSLTIGEHKITTFFDDVFDWLPNVDVAHLLVKGTGAYTVAQALLEAARTNYAEANAVDEREGYGSLSQYR